jgi:polycystin 1L2
MEKFHFICQQWLAVEKDDGKIERMLIAANEIEKHQFSYVLSKRAYHSVSDGHLWFSIFSRPPSNQFTRIQRCTCCFVLFFISMFINIMYYDLSNEVQTANVASLSLGPIYISSEQISIGIIVDLFALIPSILLVQFFRRIRIRQQHISPLHKIKSHLKKPKSGLTFPWWYLFVVYGLCLILTGISIFFIIVRGIEFGDLKTQKWLTSILTGFFSSILLTQPLKILSLAIFFACFCRNTNDDQEANEYLDDNQIDLDIDEDYLQVC